MDLIETFRAKGALLEGHFGLTSGFHSTMYLQCALLLQHPEIAREVGERLARLTGGGRVDAVISPAVGGIVIGQETAFFLKARAIFAERVEGRMALRRGFAVQPGERVLAVEDVVTTGGSIKEVAHLAEERGGRIVATASIVHRYAEGKPVPPTEHPHYALLTIHAPLFSPQDCPLCRKGMPLDKPGSRSLQR